MKYTIHIYSSKGSVERRVPANTDRYPDIIDNAHACAVVLSRFLQPGESLTSDIYRDNDPEPVWTERYSDDPR